MRLLLIIVVSVATLLTAIHTQAQAQPARVEVTVTDQNGKAVPGAFIVILQNGTSVASAQTNFSGRSALTPPPGAFTLEVQKKGFYTARSEPAAVSAGQETAIQVQLQQYREFFEEIEVVGQPSPIDVQTTASTRTLTSDEIVNIPYPSTRDYRNILPYFPGVIVDNGGQPHIAGADTRQAQDYIDGFEVSQPAGGTLQMRISPDSIRQINVESSRYSTQFGKGSGGVLSLESEAADNKLRFRAIDFIPTVQFVKGLNFNNWTPRAIVSGPIVKNTLWFYASHEGENDLTIIKEQPAGQDKSMLWRTDDLVKLQFNQGSRNTLVAFVLFNYTDTDHAGISAFTPAASTTNQTGHNYITGIKDDLFVAKDTLLDFGFGVQKFRETDSPIGTIPFVQTPNGVTGSAFEFDDGESSRTQGFANFFLPPQKLFGRHEFRVGIEADEVRDSLLFNRQLVTDVDVNGIATRKTLFQNVPRFDVGLNEQSGYAQDRWTPMDRMAVEAGVRFDRDSSLRDNLISPRIAGTFMLEKSSETKISGGVGRYYDRSSLDLLTRPLQGSRTDFFLNPNGSLVIPAIQTSFIANSANLHASDFLNWSGSLERKLPWGIYGRFDYMYRAGDHGAAYQPSATVPGAFELATNRQERYRAAAITIRKDLKAGYPFFLSYTRSSSHSSQTLDFSVDNLVFGPQLAGPTQWDAPNQLVSWGWYPFRLPWLGKFDFLYSLIWRSGFPFFVVDQQQQLVPSAGFRRFPDFLTLDPAIERKFTLRHYQFALRLGINNITNNTNASAVNNNIDSPQFLTFGGTGHRTLNARIRLLGKK